MDNTQGIADIISEAADAFFQEVDPEDTDTDDLAWAIIRYARDKGVRIEMPSDYDARGHANRVI